MVEVYVDDFMSLVIPISQEQLQRMATTVMMGIHDVFPSDDNDSNNPISESKLIKDEGQYSTGKMLLGFDFNGSAKTMWRRGRSSLLFLRAGYGWVRGVRQVYLSKNLNWLWQNFGTHLRVSWQEWVCYHHATGSSNSTQPLCICIKTTKYSMQLRVVDLYYANQCWHPCNVAN
jgi:hypothetical protein